MGQGAPVVSVLLGKNSGLFLKLVGNLSSKPPPYECPKETAFLLECGWQK